MEDKQLIAHLNSVLVFKNNNLRSEHEVSVAKYLSQSTCRRVRVAGYQSQGTSRRAPVAMYQSQRPEYQSSCHDTCISALKPVYVNWWPPECFVRSYNCVCLDGVLQILTSVPVPPVTPPTAPARTLWDPTRAPVPTVTFWGPTTCVWVSILHSLGRRLVKAITNID